MTQVWDDSDAAFGSAGTVSAQLCQEDGGGSVGLAVSCTCVPVCVYAHVCPWPPVCLKKKDQILWIYGLLCRRKTKLLVLSESLWK